MNLSRNTTEDAYVFVSVFASDVFFHTEFNSVNLRCENGAVFPPDFVLYPFFAGQLPFHSSF